MLPGNAWRSRSRYKSDWFDASADRSLVSSELTVFCHADVVALCRRQSGCRGDQTVTMAGSRILNAAFKLSTASFCNRHPVTAAQDPGLAGTTMAFQVNLPNEEAWAKEIAGSQSGVVQG